MRVKRPPKLTYAAKMKIADLCYFILLMCCRMDSSLSRMTPRSRTDSTGLTVITPRFKLMAEGPRSCRRCDPIGRARSISVRVLLVSSTSGIVFDPSTVGAITDYGIRRRTPVRRISSSGRASRTTVDRAEAGTHCRSTEWTTGEHRTDIVWRGRIWTKNLLIGSRASEPARPPPLSNHWHNITCC